MRTIGNWLKVRWTRLGVGSAGRRAAITAAVALVLAGAGWLATSGATRMVPVLDRPWTPSDLGEAQEALTLRGIDHRVESGRLVVPPSRLQESRSILQEEVLGAGGESEAMEQLVQKEDIWSSQSQIAKRWQAAKMAAMARLIRRFAPVRSATVVFEEGASGGMGGGGTGPTASVGVELRSGFTMTDSLVEAIADLVAGGVAGMKRQDVRVVDSTGRSYRAEETLAVASPALRQVRAAEDYFTKKVRSAIPAIEGAVVSVRVETREAAPAAAGGGELPRCAETRVSLPRSYFVGVARAATGQKQPDEAAVQSALAAGLDQVRDMVTAALGEKDPARIRVDWHYDDSSARVEAAAVPLPPPAESWRQWRVAVACGAIGGAILWALAGWLLRRRRGSAPASGARRAGASGASGADSPRGVLGVLQWASVEDLCSLAQGEHPQTVAVLLSALPADRAGVVLAALAPETQKEVARRIVALERIEPDMLREVDRALAGRLGELPSETKPAIGGAAKLADLLHRAGHTTEARVLQSLSQELPGLVESLRKRPMSFEDIAALGESRLGSVLERMDSRRLAVALRTASKPLAQKVYSCLSAHAARRLRAQVEQVGPVRLSEVEAAQQQIVAELAAEDAGQYAAAGAADQVA